jgi:hypothetical protein
MPQPYEYISGPFKIYLAAVGTAFPATPETAIGGAWTLLGSSGEKNYNEDGIVIRNPQNIERHRAYGTTGPRKAFRTEEDMEIEVTLEDLTLEQYKYALNGGAVTDTPAASGVAGHRALPLKRGRSVTQYALLIRAGESPYGDGWSMQYEIPRVFVDGDAEATSNKEGPMGVPITFVALEDDSLGFGNVRATDAAAL